MHRARSRPDVTFPANFGSHRRGRSPLAALGPSQARSRPYKNIAKPGRDQLTGIDRKAVSEAAASQLRTRDAPPLGRRDRLARERIRSVPLATGPCRAIARRKAWPKPGPSSGRESAADRRLFHASHNRLRHHFSQDLAASRAPESAPLTTLERMSGARLIEAGLPAGPPLGLGRICLEAPGLIEALPRAPR
jgi:hypothetical protein